MIEILLLLVASFVIVWSMTHDVNTDEPAWVTRLNSRAEAYWFDRWHRQYVERMVGHFRDHMTPEQLYNYRRQLNEYRGTTK